MTDFTNVIMVGGALLIEMAIGYILVKLRIIKRRHIPAINKFVFKICYIPLMGRSFALRDFFTMDWIPFLSCLATSFTCQILVGFVFLLPFKDKFREYLALVLPSVYINYVVVGIPIFDTMWGEENNAIMSMIIMSNDLVIAPIYQFWVSLYKYFEKNRELKQKGLPPEKFSIKVIGRVLLTVIQNPLVIGIGCGIIYSLTKLPFPPYLNEMCKILATPIGAMIQFCVGGYLSQYSLVACPWWEFIVCLLFKCVIMPLMSGVFADLIGLTATQSRQVLAMAAVTSAVACFPLTQASGIGQGIATTMIFWTTILVIPTIIGWFAVLDKLGIFIEEPAVNASSILI